MLLNILNLPSNVKFSEIKELVRLKCGINEIILDNLVPHDKHTKKVTIGLAGEEDAAIFMRKMNGVNMNGHRLQVVPKSKIPSLLNTNPPSQNRGMSSYENNGQQGSYWPPGQYFEATPQPLMANPAMPNPSMPNYGDPNMFGMYPNPNQGGYYTMNQAGYETIPSAPNVGIQPVSYPSNQNYSQNVWQNSNLSQQQQPIGFSNTQQERDPKWDNKPEWLWDNNSNNRDLRKNSNDFRQDKSFQPSGFQNKQQERQRDQKWDNKPESGWDNNRNNRDLRRYDSNDSRRVKSSQPNRDSFRPEQSAGSSRDHGSQYRGNEKNYSPPASSPGRYRDLSNERYQRDERSFQDRNKSKRSRSPDRRREDQHAPPLKRSRFTGNVVNKPTLESSGSGAGDKKSAAELRRQKEIENARSVRGQLVAAKAKEMIVDKRFKYAPNKRHFLLTELKNLLRARIDDLFKDNYTIPLREMKEVYAASFNFKSHFVLFKDALAKVNGKLLSKANVGEGKQKPSKVPQSGTVGGQPQHKAAEVSTSIPAKKMQTKGNAAQSNPGSIPLALIPGRIPQYKQGDKKLHIREKRELADEMSNIMTDGNSRAISSLKPELRKAMVEELEQLFSVVEGVCQQSVPDITGAERFFDIIREQVPKELVSIMKVNIVRRMVPSMPVMVRVFAVPPIKRLPLENFLKDYNISALKKSKFKPYYVATCENVADHDKLCMMKPVLVDDCLLTFKPFHLVENKKIHKGQAQKERKALIRQQMQQRNINYAPEMAIEDDCEEYGEEDVIKEMKTETEDLYQEMKDIFEKINNPDQDQETEINENVDKCKRENNQNVDQPIKEDNYESPLKWEGEYETDNGGIDFANDEHNIDNFNEEPSDDCLLVEDKVGELKRDTAIADNINLADVNDDDLEDW